MRKSFGNIHVYQAQNLKSYDTIIHGFAPYVESVTKPLDLHRNNVSEYETFCEKIKTPLTHMCLVKQVHKDDILVIKKNEIPAGVYPSGGWDLHSGTSLKKFRTQEFDAIITNQKNVLLGITTADCIPLVLFDPKTLTIGAIHGGWKSTALKIAEKTVKKMKEEFKVDPKNILAALGPGICRRCFEVGIDVASKFQKEFLERKDDHKFKLDLCSVHEAHLENAGVPSHNIETLNLCTFHYETKFFSYRRDKTEKRHLNFIMLK